MATKSLRRAGSILTCLTLFGASACGKKPKDGGGGRAVGKVEQAFLDASAATGVPVRFLMAAGYVESRLVAENATSNYVSLDNSTDPVPRGTVMTQTAFGLTYEKIGLDPAKEGSTTLEVQIEAYARWVASSLSSGGISLAPNPVSREEKHYWLENLALLHRSGVEGVRAVQVMFAREMIATLNDGFTWQDPRGDEILKLAAETPPIDIDAADYPQSGKNWFKIPSRRGLDLQSVRYFQLATLPSGTVINDPVRIEVIHCPLTLSACLELQTRSQDGDAQLGSYVYLSAHYVIPSDVDVYDPDPLDVLQVAPHDQAVTITDGRGENVKVQDAIVIMLTGNSGRTVAGTRQPAVPTWFSNGQLMAMSDLINQLCTKLSTKDENPINRDDCLKTEGDRGIQFRHQGDSEEYRWGDIADFDATIFNAYIRNAGGLSDEVAFELKNGNREFRAGTQVPLTVLFNSSAREVQIERLRRCQSGKLIWETVSNEQVRAGNRVVVAKPFFDSGPNHSGEQFFRARVYGADTKLTGWAIESVNLTGYDKEPSFASEKNCGG
jgi:hypothetical protein